jgi:hypothetical protein
MYRPLCSSLIAVGLGLLALGSSSPGRAADLESAPAADPTTVEETVTPIAPEGPPPNPRLKLSYERFSIGNVDGTAVPLDAIHLDVYPLSRRWLRAGFEIEGGRGTAALFGDHAALTYGMLGANAGIQWPLGGVTPFVEGRLCGGLLHGQTVGSIMLDGGTITSAEATTWIYGRGLEVGAEVYVLGRSYLSLSLGWLRTTWRGAQDTSATASGDLALTDITHDAFLFKLGLGF